MTGRLGHVSSQMSRHTCLLDIVSSQMLNPHLHSLAHQYVG